MQLLVYICTYPLLWVISILPFRLFYLFSDLVFFMVYHVVGYRKQVVHDNLKLVFPTKTDREIKQIRKDFFKHFCDMFLETVRTMSLSKKDAAKHFKVRNMDLLLDLEKSTSVLLLCSHYGNWEWIISINNYLASNGYAVYQKVGNFYFDRMIKRIRGRWNTTPITQKETVKTIMLNEQENKRAVYGMVSDQSPMAHRAQYWTEFMGVKAPIFTGAESLARKLDLAVVFLKVSKVKRGFYEAECIPITLSGSATAEHEITDRFLELTEHQILERPEYYLWTHRRWKHSNKVPDTSR